MGTGWRPSKFVVKHYRRGDLLDGEAFVLVPERDPAALVALRAYADATPDPELADRLHAWTQQLDSTAPVQSPTAEDMVPTWVATLSAQIQADEVSVETALFRIAGLAASRS